MMDTAVKKSKRIAYVLSIFGTLIPAWIGDGILASEDVLTSNGTMTIVFVFFGIALCGTSIGFFYIRSWKYAIVAILGKFAVIIIFISADYFSANMTEPGHPYLTAIGIGLAMIWGVFDLGWLNVLFDRKYKKESKSDLK